MHDVYLLLGGNLGNRENNLHEAATLIGFRCGKLLRGSSIYETEAWGLKDQPSFLNQVLEIETPMEAEELLEELLAIEQQLGRQRLEKYGPRLIDIDILFYDSEVIDRKTLIVPHPRIADRRFVLEPMNELSPSLIHPVNGKTIHQLLLDCKDPLKVNKFS